MSDPLPPRYDVYWRGPFDAAVAEAMSSGEPVLDLGSGRHPAVPGPDRPAGIEYVGLDLSAEELEAAGPDAYDERVVSDASTFRPALEGRFGLVLSWQVLEHVPDLEAAVVNVGRYLKPGGVFVAMFSGGRSAFGLINRMLPDRIGEPLVDRVMRRTEQNVPVFPAYYDRCVESRFSPLFDDWADLVVTPFYRGAGYFGFLPPLRRAYLAYENAIARRGAADFATHYLLVATR